MPRLSANIPAEEHERLQRVATRYHNGIVTNAVISAGRTYEHIRDAAAEGKHVILRDPRTGEEERVVLI